MIYYYYGSKERLYLAALERAYEDIRVTEASVDVEHLDPVTAVRTLAQLTFDRHEANPDFSRLISQENVQRPVRLGGEWVPGLDRRSSRCSTTRSSAVANKVSSCATSTLWTCTC